MVQDSLQNCRFIDNLSLISYLEVENMINLHFR